MSFDKTLALMTGVDIPIPECALVIHQPSIKEISYVGEKEYFLAVQALCADKSFFGQDKTSLTDFNNFQIFMMIITDPSGVQAKNAVTQAFTILFPQYKVTLTVRSLIFTLKDVDDVQPVLVDENNFIHLQQVLKDICCIGASAMQTAGFNPQDAKAREIAEKLQRARQRVAQQNNGGKDTSFFVQYISILTIGVNSMSLKECLDLTMFQLFDLVERYTLYSEWNIDMRVRLAGGSSNSHPDNWMKSIH